MFTEYLNGKALVRSNIYIGPITRKYVSPVATCATSALTGTKASFGEAPAHHALQKFGVATWYEIRTAL